MAQINIGRILPIFKGDWNSNAIYSKLDVVLYSGSSWVALAENSGEVPDTSAVDWEMVARKGSWTDFTTEEKEELVEALIPYVDNISITEGTNTYNDF